MSDSTAMADISSQVAGISEKLSAAAEEPPPEKIPEGISMSVVSVSERLTALEDAVKKIQEQLAGPTTSVEMSAKNLLPSKGGARRTRRRRRAASKKRSA